MNQSTLDYSTKKPEVLLRQAKEFLCSNDPIIGHISAHIGECMLRPSGDHFGDLVRMIVSQQLSNTAALTIYGRVTNLCEPDSSPKAIYDIDDKVLWEVGVSRQKTNSIKNLASLLCSDPQYLINCKGLSNEAVMERLCAIKGIGPWTSEMFMIFSLFRLNVLSNRDMALRNAVTYYYHLDHPASDSDFDQLSKKWGAFSSVASWYLWKGRDNKVGRQS